MPVAGWLLLVWVMFVVCRVDVRCGRALLFVDVCCGVLCGVR